MKIDEDANARTKLEAAISTIDNNVESTTEIAGLRGDNKIFLPPASVIKSITTYCHECGHFIGDYLSFQSGLNNGEESDVLSIDEVKNPKTYIELTREEQSYLSTRISSTNIKAIDLSLTSIANKLLITFTKGKFNPSSITCYIVNQEQLESMVANIDTPTIGRDAVGNLIAVNSREGRDLEIPSYVTELCCLQILENTLHHYGIFSSDECFINEVTKSPSHQRARNIIARAFRGKGWRLPSVVDMKKN